MNLRANEFLDPEESMPKIVLRFAAKLIGPNDNQVEFNRALLQRYRAKFGLTRMS